MQKIASIGHSFHQKTKSTQFFIDVLLEFYEIDFYWSLPMNYKADLKLFDLENKDYHALIFFQILPTAEELQQCLCKNIVLIPMFDNDLGMTLKQWSEYFQYKFINFSKTLYEKLDFLDFKNNVYLQYAPNVHQLKQVRNHHHKPKVFFWQRSDKINWNLLKKLIDFSQVSSFHLHRIEAEASKDSWFEMPDQQDIEAYNITLSSWFDSKDELSKLMNDCDIFICPRLFEGIGQTFLEAMAMGKCVVSPNFPTMNEYINNGLNGILFDFLEPKTIDLTQWEKIGHEAYESMKNIRYKWEHERLSIIDFIEKPLVCEAKEVSYHEYLKNLEITLNDKKSKFLAEDIKISLLMQNPSKSLDFSKYLNVLLDYFSKNISSTEKYIVYGTGTGARLISNLIGIDNVEYFIDIDERKHTSLFDGKEVFSPKKLKETNHKVLISLFGRGEKIMKFLSNDYEIEKVRLINLDFN
ncbi:MAG TPA: hypothetical protein CFH84_11600 [Sulfurimonas sp. UBA12504]|nr:MAG TPA: hypothetical protein CFH84_11600 [Sulfurimonas sp. UBA12504]